ncbi:MAG: hypothetical protein K0S86_5865 [Geminicoccaceae bacterium]|nr:hypothetical protein [Geminicoccaceae bacterium]
MSRRAGELPVGEGVSKTRVTDRAGGWQVPPDQIPMPGVSANAGPRVLEWLELESVCRHPDVASVRKQPILVRRNEVRHRVSLPAMTVQPKAAVHRVDHPITPAGELAV